MNESNLHFIEGVIAIGSTHIKGDEEIDHWCWVQGIRGRKC